MSDHTIEHVDPDTCGTECPNCGRMRCCLCDREAPDGMCSWCVLIEALQDE